MTCGSTAWPTCSNERRTLPRGEARCVGRRPLHQVPPAVRNEATVDQRFAGLRAAGCRRHQGPGDRRLLPAPLFTWAACPQPRSKAGQDGKTGRAAAKPPYDWNQTILRRPRASRPEALPITSRLTHSPPSHRPRNLLAPGLEGPPGLTRRQERGLHDHVITRRQAMRPRMSIMSVLQCPQTHMTM